MSGCLKRKRLHIFFIVIFVGSFWTSLYTIINHSFPLIRYTICFILPITTQQSQVGNQASYDLNFVKCFFGLAWRKICGEKCLIRSIWILNLGAIQLEKRYICPNRAYLISGYQLLIQRLIFVTCPRYIHHINITLNHVKSVRIAVTVFYFKEIEYCFKRARSSFESQGKLDERF